MFKNIGFRRQLSIVFSVGIILLALATTIVISKVSTETMRERIINEGKQLAEALAEHCTLALLYGSEENAADAVDILSAFEDVVGVSVHYKDKTILYQKGKDNSKYEENLVVDNFKIIVEDEKDVWQFVAPVAVNQDLSANISEGKSQGPEIIGYVKILMSKKSLREMAADIFMYNLLVSLGLAAVLLVVLMMISRRLLKPIHHLANVMSAAQKGEQVQQVEMRGPPDIQEMFKAFNTMVDILKRREQELQKSRDEAVELAQLKGEFAANVSHELRTPMNGVLGMLEMLEDTALTGKDREYLVVARNSAKSLLTLINDILDFSKNEAGKTVLDMENFDLYIQIEEIVALLGTQTQKKKIDFAYILEEDLQRYVHGDANRLRQLLINLVSNAIKFTERGTVSIEVESLANGTAKVNEIKLKFSIIDTGIGIQLEKQAHIFEAFSQADGSTTRKFGGTGLGLSICKQLVEMMGGEIGVESRPGEGSRFWFTILLKKWDNPETKIDDKQLGSQKLNILVFEKNSTVQRSLKSMLRRCKQECKIASSKDEVLTALYETRKNRPLDLLIMDEFMEESALVELADYAKSLNKKTICVKLSFSIRDFDIKENRSVNLAKPVLFNHLMLAVKGALSGTGLIDVEEKRDFQENSKQDSNIIFPGIKMLVVDDNPVNQMVALGLLKPLKCETDTAVNGIDCLKKLKEKSYDIILMDCNMPEMDGYKASEIIRDRETESEHIIIIAITANAGPGDRHKCIASGMDDYLVKPFNREDLKAKLARWLPTKKTYGSSD